jgi:hypothetical protein
LVEAVTDEDSVLVDGIVVVVLVAIADCVEVDGGVDATVG